LLKEWRGLAEDPGREEFVFPSEALRTPDNLWRRIMQPKVEKIGLGWATFQVLRKTNANLAKKYGVDPKEVYTNSDIEQERAAVNKLEAAMLRKRKQPRP
jgi:hypothetical protein